MARPAIIVGNYKYSGTDAHRTLLSVGSLWRHHLHDVKLDPNQVASVGAELSQSLQLLADLHNAKPELEIYADDVKCAHGCAIGELDAMGLFYLQARGITPAEAKKLMLQAFVAGVFEGAAGEAAALLQGSTLNAFMGAGAPAWSALRLALSRALRAGSAAEDCHQP